MIREDKRVWWRWDGVGEGESLGQIAKSYKTTPAAIAEVNNITSVDTLTPGARLVIPITPKNPSIMAAATEGKKTRVLSLRYKVRKGDTLAVVASRFGVEQEEVKQWNKLKTDTLAPGRVLTIRAIQTGPAPSARKSAASRKGITTAAHKRPAARITPARAPSTTGKATGKSPGKAAAQGPPFAS